MHPGRYGKFIHLYESMWIRIDVGLNASRPPDALRSLSTSEVVKPSSSSALGHGRTLKDGGSDHWSESGSNRPFDASRFRGDDGPHQRPDTIKTPDGERHINTSLSGNGVDTPRIRWFTAEESSNGRRDPGCTNGGRLDLKHEVRWLCADVAKLENFQPQPRCRSNDPIVHYAQGHASESGQWRWLQLHFVDWCTGSSDQTFRLRRRQRIRSGCQIPPRW